ncbi:uncharacterized, partial [Tachysurus ichikawai]
LFGLVTAERHDSGM